MASSVEEGLPDHRLGGPGQIAQAAVVGGDVPPSEHRQSFRSGLFRQDLLATAPRLGVLGQEENSHAVMFLGGKRKTEGVGLGAEELIGDLDKNPGAVAGRFVGARRAAVHEVQQHLLAVLDNGMIAASCDVDDGADAAGIVFPLRIIQTLSTWHGKSHPMDS